MKYKQPGDFTPQELAIHKILLEEWDPIGIADSPGSQEEYDHYIPGIVELISKKAGQQEIAKHLWKIQTEEMGMFREQFRAEHAADLLSKMGNA